MIKLIRLSCGRYPFFSQLHILIAGIRPRHTWITDSSFSNLLFSNILYFLSYCVIIWISIILLNELYRSQNIGSYPSISQRNDKNCCNSNTCMLVGYILNMWYDFHLPSLETKQFSFKGQFIVFLRRIQLTRYIKDR